MADQIIPITKLDELGITPLYRTPPATQRPLEVHSGIEAGRSRALTDLARYDRVGQKSIGNTAYGALDKLLGSGIKVNDYLSKKTSGYMSNEPLVRYNTRDTVTEVSSAIYSMQSTPQVSYQPCQGCK